jgi:small GTP-binding protein
MNIDELAKSLGMDKNDIRHKTNHNNEIVWLDLSNNKISNIDELGKLKKLTKLDLNNNKISNIDELGKLEKLTWLDLSHNKISNIDELGKLEKLTGLFVDNNPIISPPIEVVNSGIDAIRSYIKDNNKEYLREAKLIILGEPDSGKSSFVRRLLHNKFDEHSKSTLGSDIHPYNFFDDKQNKYKLNIWDFGGQDIQQSIHHLFLTPKALYLVMLDARGDESPIKWLETIKGFDKNANIIIAINQIDINSYPNVNEREIKKFSNNIIGFFYISCKIDNHPELANLIKCIKKEIIKLPSIQEKYPKKWINIKSDIEIRKQNKTNYMNISSYHSLCEPIGVADKDADIFLEVLDNIGTIRWFNDFDYNDFQIFNPSWLSVGLYHILTNDSMKKDNGIIDKNKIKAILNSINSDEYGFKYKEDEVPFFIEAIIRYKFAFLKNNKYLIPKGFNQKPIENIDFDRFESKKYIQYIIEFEDFAPSWIVHRLMISMFTNIDKQYWFYGFVYNHNEYNGLIELSEDSKKLFIHIDKNNKKMYHTIKFLLLDIFGDTIVLNIKEWVKFGKDNKSIANLSQLQNYKNKNIEMYRDSDTLEEIEVANLLDFFPSRANDRINQILNEVKENNKTNKEILKINENIREIINKISSTQDIKEQVSLKKQLNELVNCASGLSNAYAGIKLIMGLIQ